jgi:pimeloyl-ACP methyl ester carboxylesterase
VNTRNIRTNGVNLHVVDEGQGPAVLLLHGFPDSSKLWRHQIRALVQAGFRAVAPDLRGFGQSDMPPGVENYALPVILQDVLGILNELQIDRAHVVAHDWGAAAAWMLAALHPTRVDHFVTLSVAHPNAFTLAGFDQNEKHWYMLLFQFADIAEQLLAQDDWQFFRAWSRNHPESGSWIADLARPGALTAGLNWYRANAAPAGLLHKRPLFPTVTVPTLAVWGSEDAYLLESLIVRSVEWVSGPWRYERLVGASHWLQLDQPAQVNQLLVEFLTG